MADGAFRKATRNRNVKCKGKSVIRDARQQPILDADNARQYRPCDNWGANGTDFCQKHGGQLEPTIIAAKRRLLYGADDMVEILKRIAQDETVAPADRVRALNSYLDRAGIRAGMDVNVDAPKWQGVLGKLFGSPEDPEDEDGEETPAPPPRKAATKKATPSATPPAGPKFEGW